MTQVPEGSLFAPSDQYPIIIGVIDANGRVRALRQEDLGGTSPAPGESAILSDRVAAANLGGHRVVTTDAAGDLIYATNVELDHAPRLKGFILNAVAQGGTTPVIAIDEVTEASWNWTPTDPIFLGINGLLTQTPPTIPAVFIQEVAVAITATTILFKPQPPIILA